MAPTREIIAENIAELRRGARLTQAELAEKLNYSDKAISKWERGDSIPDVLVLYELAELFSVTVDYFLHSHTEDEKRPKLDSSKNRLRLVIALTSCLSTYFIAALVYFILLTVNPDIEGLWRIFIVPLPVISVISIVFSSIWLRGKIPLYISVSALLWSSVLVTFVFLLGVIKAWFLFIIAVPLQVIVLFWMSLLYKGKLGKKTLSAPKKK
jgi:transcriptional regulator with XRE-family HTH domain